MAFNRECKHCGKSFKTEKENYHYCCMDCRNEAQQAWNQKKKSGNVRGEGNDYKPRGGGNRYSGSKKGTPKKSSYGRSFDTDKPYSSKKQESDEKPVKTTEATIEPEKIRISIEVDKDWLLNALAEKLASKIDPMPTKTEEPAKKAEEKQEEPPADEPSPEEIAEAMGSDNSPTQDDDIPF